MKDLKTHQILKKDGHLVCWSQKLQTVVVFVSHQWCSWQHPDPDGCQLSVLQKLFVQAKSGKLTVYADVVSELCFDLKPSVTSADLRKLGSCLVWYDYFGVPQPHAQNNHTDMSTVMGKAVLSILAYVALSDFFIVLAPTVNHKDTGKAPDHTSWATRGWCRLERLARALSPGETHILLAEGAASVIECGPQEYVAAPVGMAAFTVEEDRAKIAPVVETLIRDKIFFLESTGEDDSAVWQRALARSMCEGLPLALEWLNATTHSDVVQGFEACSGLSTAKVAPTLNVAAYAGAVPAVPELLRRCVSPNTGIPHSAPKYFLMKDNTPLLLAGLAGHCQVAAMLLDASANVNDGNAVQAAALDCAALASPNVDMIELLVKRGASLSAENAFGVTPLGVACLFRQAKKVQRLLELGSSVEASGIGCLHACAIAGSEPGLIQNLIDHRADPNQQGGLENAFGCCGRASAIAHRLGLLKDFRSTMHCHLTASTPLMLAVILGKRREAGELLEAGACIEARNGRGKTALELAKMFEWPQESIDELKDIHVSHSSTASSFHQEPLLKRRRHGQ